MIYNLCLFQVYSKVNQLHMYVYLLSFFFFLRFFFHIGHYRVLSRVPCTIHWVPISYISCYYVYVSSSLLTYPPPPYSLIAISLFYTSMTLLLFCKRNHKQNKKTTLRMGENICKWSNWQGTDLQNIQIVHVILKKKKINPTKTG